MESGVKIEVKVDSSRGCRRGSKTRTSEEKKLLVQGRLVQRAKRVSQGWQDWAVARGDASN